MLLKFNKIRSCFAKCNFNVILKPIKNSPCRLFFEWHCVVWYNVPFISFQIRPNEKFSGRRIVFHFYDIWNTLDALCIILYITAFLLHSSPISDNLVHIRRLYSLSLFFMYLRVFNFLLLLRKLGIIIIMVKEMVCISYSFLQLVQ